MVYILLGNGFEEAEALVTADVLRRGGVQVMLTGIGGTTVTGAHSITVVCDVPVESVILTDGDTVVLPGGMGGVASIEGSQSAMELIHQVSSNDSMYLAAICAAPTLLARAGIIGPGCRAVCYPGMEVELTDAGAEAPMDELAVVCGTLITSQAPGTAYHFALKLLEVLTDPATARSVQAGLHCVL